jgi:VanZ family protein
LDRPRLSPDDRGRGTWWKVLVLVVWTALLMVLMTIPMAGNALSQHPQYGVFRYWDKFAHIFLFGVTAFVSVYGARFFRRFGARLFFGLGFSLFLAFGTEYAQSLISYRSDDFYDLMADLLGIFIVMFIYLAAYMNGTLRSRLRL